MKFIRTFKLHESMLDLRAELADLGLADPWKALITLRYPDLEERSELEYEEGGSFEKLVLDLEGSCLSELQIDFLPDRDEPWSLTILKKIAGGNFKLDFGQFRVWTELDHEEYYQKCAVQILQKIQSQPIPSFEIFLQDRTSFGFPQSQEKTRNPLAGWSDLVFAELYEHYPKEFEIHRNYGYLEHAVEFLKEKFFSGKEKATCSVEIWTDFPGNKIDPASPRWQANFGN
jgi:hypothetical protein